MGKTIGVFSLKGGVGKTTAVVSLGSAIASFGKKVLLVDGNLSAPNLGLHLKVISPEFSLHDVLGKKANPLQAVYKLDNFDVLPGAVFSNLEVNPMEMKDKLAHLKRSYDFILIDSSPALNNETIGAMVASEDMLFVTTPDYPTLSMTLKAVNLAKNRGASVPGIILNKVYNKNFEVPLEHVEKTLGIPVLAVIPHDTNILRALSKSIPSTEFKPKSEASEEYKKLAAVLIGEKYKQAKLKSFFSWIAPKKQEINRTIFYESVFK